MDVSITIQTNPAGTSLSYRGDTVPYGYLLEDGSLVSRVTYARLFEAIGTTYGAGDGSTTFKLPDSRGRADIGSGVGSGLTARTLGQTGGVETHQLTESEMPSHTHVQNSHNHTQNPHHHAVNGTNSNNTTNFNNIGHSSSFGVAGSQTSGGLDYYNNNTGGQILSDTTATNNAATATNQNTGGNQSHQNMAPYLVATKIIKY